MKPDLKFTVYDFAGKPHSYWGVEEVQLAPSATKKARVPAHHVMILDASGSMYNDIADVRNMVEKICTVDEYKNPDLRISLISFASRGDCKLHFAKITVEDMMRKDSKYLKEVRSLVTRGMTGMSQALMLAESIIDARDVTAISLHTDGFANDPSPTSEHRTIDDIIVSLKKRPNIFVNTIGYRDWCDYTLLAKIANSLSGACVQAKNIKQVYDALNSTTALLAGGTAPVLEIAKSDADWLVFCSPSQGKLIGGSESLFIRGLSEFDNKFAWRFKQLDAKTYEKTYVHMRDNSAEAHLAKFAAFARTQLAVGNLNFAKYVMVSSQYAPLHKHARALVSADIAAMAEALEHFAFSGKALSTGFTDKPGLGAQGPTVLDVLGVLNDYTDGFLVNIERLKSGYKRRGLKRQNGVWENGKFTPFHLETTFRDDSPWVETSGFEFNNTEATINMLISRPVDLVRASDKKRINEVAGIKLDKLRAYNNYTIISDGMLNVQELTFRVTSKELWEELCKLAVAVGPFNHNETLTIYLTGFPLVAYDFEPKAIAPETFEKLLKLTILQKALKAITAAPEVAGARFSQDQFKALKDHGLTPALYFSPPTTNPYNELTDAIAKGEVDYRLAYQVKLGNADVLHLGELYSANKYLQRRWEHATEKEPTWALWGAGFNEKKLSARTKLTSIDDVTFPIYNELLGCNVGVGGAAGASLYEVVPKKEWKWISELSDANTLAAKAVLGHVEKAIEKIYATQLRPLVFQVGASGIVPDSLGATALTADQFEAKYPSYGKLGKAERESGTFFVLANGLVLSVFAEAKLFSTGA